MVERFAPLPDDHEILRLASPGGQFLPRGRVLPLPAWLTPSSADKREAAERGRVPGLSVWDLNRCEAVDARARAGRDDELGFVAGVAALRAVGAALLDPPYRVDVVADPLDAAQPAPGWDAHALVEGLARSEGQPKATWKELRERAIRCFRAAEGM